MNYQHVYLFNRLRRKEEEILGDLLRDLQHERERSKSLEAQVRWEFDVKCFQYSRISVNESFIGVDVRGTGNQ